MFIFIYFFLVIQPRGLASKHDCAYNPNRRLQTTDWTSMWYSGIIPAIVARARSLSAVNVHLVPTLTVWRANAGSNSNSSKTAEFIGSQIGGADLRVCATMLPVEFLNRMEYMKRQGFDKDRWQISGVWLGLGEGIGSAFLVVTWRTAVSWSSSMPNYVRNA